MKKLVAVALLLVTVSACSKSGVTSSPPTPPPPPAPAARVSGANTGNFKSDRPNNLNLIYFVPSDADTIKGYIQRLSTLLLYDRNWMQYEMQRNGYGNKTFGLLADAATSLIKVITVYGTQPKSSYPYSGGGTPMQQEISNYFAAHPADKTSEHTLVITPAYSYDANGEPGGPPFYGLGKWCFALDYADFDIKYLGQTNTLGNRMTKWFGGMTHELGHGLNLPHNHAKVSEMTTLGTTLMGAGNYTFGQKPTFLSAADAAVLNVNQAFNTDALTYYGKATAAVTRIKAVYDAAKDAIVVSGKFTADVLVTDVLYFNDPNVNNEGTGVNKDYNAIAWTAKPIGTDSFYAEMKLNDLEHKEDNIPYELKVKLVHQNGSVTETIYSYTFLNAQPVLNFSTRDELGKQGWSITSVSSEETSAENGRAINLIDGSGSTYWHSRWSANATVYPHEVVVDMGAVKSVRGFSVTQRSGLSRSVKDLELLTSTDGVNFVSVSSYVLANSNGPQYFDFSSAKSFRYFKIIARSAWDGQQFAALAEAGMY